MRRLRKSVLVGLAAGSIAALLVAACHVFESVDKCASDADCPSGSTCDAVGRFCTAPADTAVPDTAVPDTAVPDTSVADVEVDVRDAAPTSCDTRDSFTSFSLVHGLEGTPILTARLTSDERNVLYSALDGCELESCLDLYVAQRNSLDQPFGSGSPLAAVNCNQSAEYWATLSANGLLLFFEGDRALVPQDGMCGNDTSRIWSATRVSTSTDFDPPQVAPLFQTEAGALDSAPYLHPDGRSLYFVSLGRPGTGNQDIYVASTDPLGLVSTISEVSTVNTTGIENFPVITRDDETLYFARGSAPRTVWMTRRSNPTAPFAPPTELPDFIGSDDNIPAWISDDNCRFYFVSNRVSPDGGMVSDYRLWVAERTPR